jgi:magnesium-transporting ATPase (P-type)
VATWDETEKIMIVKKNKENELCDLETNKELNIGPGDIRYVTTFMFHNMRYVWVNDRFVTVKQFIQKQTVKEFLDNYEYGVNKDEIEHRRNTYGVNEIKVEEHSIAHMLFHELTSTLGLFEVVSFIIMSYEYRYFSLVMVVFFVISVIIQIISEKKCERRIKKFAQYKDKIIVIRRNKDKTFSKIIIK